MMACLEASFLESWWTITAALLTTTCDTAIRESAASHVVSSDCLSTDQKASWAIAHLVLIIEQLCEFRDGARGELCVILVVDQVHNGMLQHLGWLGQALDIGGVRGIELRGWDLHTLVQCLREHGGPHPLRTCHCVLPVDVWRPSQCLVPAVSSASTTATPTTRTCDQPFLPHPRHRRH